MLPAEAERSQNYRGPLASLRQRNGKDWKVKWLKKGWDARPWASFVCLPVLSSLVCGWKDNPGATSTGRRGADKQVRSWNWKCATDSPPPCCWELMWALSFSYSSLKWASQGTIGDLEVPESVDCGQFPESTRTQGTWVKSVAWRRSGSPGRVGVPLASAHLTWIPFFAGHLALFGGLFDKGLLGPIRVVSSSNPEDWILSDCKWVVLFCPPFPTQFYVGWGISGTS